MSWKGVKKSISRLPHTLKTRNGTQDEDRDLEYSCLESRYKQLVQLSNELCNESMIYRDGISSVLNQQLQFANHLSEIYSLQSDQTISPETQQGLDDYSVAMEFCREETMALLDELDATVIKPASSYQAITKSIDKAITKRHHKLIDFDRHKHSYIKYSTIPNPSPSEEKNMFKMKNQYETSQQEYNYYNDMLKDDLIKFLNLTQCFLEPVMISFYHIQHRIYSGFYGRVYEVIQHNPLPTSNLSIQEGLETRFNESQILNQLEQYVSFIMTESKSFGRKGLSQSSLYRHDVHEPPTITSRSPSVSNSHLESLQLSSSPYQQASVPAVSYQENKPIKKSAAPPPLKKKPELSSYSSLNNNNNSNSLLPDQQTVLKKKRAPPPPPPPSRGPKKEYVEALYDYGGDMEGDLSFSVGDRIEIIEKTESTDDWWKGKIGNQVGMFPCNFTKSI
ncbi:hypothetical protein BD770DRAFT_190280 [Pilaira anomala]|nr:hypothetical protein BD770DRAFT_190280 [Pilaira anomala]